MKKAVLALALLFCAAGAPAQFGENKIAYDKFDWKTYRSTHFTIYFYEKERSSRRSPPTPRAPTTTSRAS